MTNPVGQLLNPEKVKSASLKKGREKKKGRDPGKPVHVWWYSAHRVSVSKAYSYLLLICDV